MAEVDAWFDKQGYSSEFVRCSNGISLDELEYGDGITDDITDAFVEAAESDFSGAEWR